MKIRAVADEGCPRCGTNGSPKVTDEIGRQWWKCLTDYETCKVSYWLPETGEIEWKETPEKAVESARRIKAEVDQMMKGKTWVESSPGLWTLATIEEANQPRRKETKMPRKPATKIAATDATETEGTETMTVTADATEIAANATEGSDFDFATLAASSVETDEMEKARRNRERKANPFDAILAASKENGKAYVVPSVPAPKVDDLKRLLRNAATFLEVSVKIVTSFNDDGSVRVSYKATEKRAYKPRKNGDDA